MRHVAPHLWSELAKLPAKKRRALHTHADGCDACGHARDRIAELPAVFAEIRAAEAPEIEWDHVGAQIHWSSSLERRTGERPAISSSMLAAFDTEPPPRRWPRVVLGAGVLAAAAALGVIVLSGTGSDSSDTIADQTKANDTKLEAVPVVLAEASPLRAVVVQTKGAVSINSEAPNWQTTISAGARLETGDGQLVVQFDRGGGFALGPSSSVTLRSFDSQSVELVLEGTLDVMVSRRAPDQQFVVVAGERTARVRGTAFRVRYRDGDLDVACEHGRVEVAGRGGVVDVERHERFVAEKGADLRGGTAVALSGGELRGLATELALPLLAGWKSAEQVVEGTAAVSILARPDSAVSVDGRSVGSGSMELRLGLGRHEIAVAGAGPWAKGRWIDLDGEPGEVRIVHANQGATAPTQASTERVRRVELRLALRENQARLRRCVARFARAEVAGGIFVDLRVDINGDGSIAAVNAGKSNVDLETRRCILAAVGALKLPRGARGTAQTRWRP